MQLCIYASEVAKLANMHAYESQESAIQKICERYNIDAVEQASKAHETAILSKELEQSKLEALKANISQRNNELVQLKSMQRKMYDPIVQKDIARIIINET